MALDTALQRKQTALEYDIIFICVFNDSARGDARGARSHDAPWCRQRPAFRGNTTLAVIATNARLDRVQVNKVAALASNGVARAISPVNTMSDGDMTFAISVGNEDASVDAVGIAAAEALAMAVLRAVRLAKTAGGIPGLAG
jgi:L-aminopeptidase/D-esterase-like protein